MEVEGYSLGRLAVLKEIETYCKKNVESLNIAIKENDSPYVLSALRGKRKAFSEMIQMVKAKNRKSIMNSKVKSN